MEEKDMKKIQDDIRRIAKKHNVKEASFTGKCGDNFIGFIVDPQTPVGMVECAYNVGRLWQHVRTLVRDSMNRFESEQHLKGR